MSEPTINSNFDNSIKCLGIVLCLIACNYTLKIIGIIFEMFGFTCTCKQFVEQRLGSYGGQFKSRKIVGFSNTLSRVNFRGMPCRTIICFY